MTSTFVGLPALARPVRKNTVAAKAAVARPAARKAVVATASMERKATAAVSTAAAALSASPAFALVDQRLNGDGVGLPLGVSDPILFYIIAGVFTTVWAVFYVSDLTADEDDDEEYGLKIRDD